MTATPTSPAPRWKTILRHPAALCAVSAFALVGVGDQYPLSPFPMYSRLGEARADMLLITNEADKPLPMSKLFNVGSAQGKKRFESELKEVSGTKEYEDTTPEKRRQAGETFLANLWKDRDASDVAKWNPQLFRLKIRTVALEDGKFLDTTTLIAEMAVPQTEGGAK